MDQHGRVAPGHDVGSSDKWGTNRGPSPPLAFPTRLLMNRTHDTMPGPGPCPQPSSSCQLRAGTASARTKSQIGRPVRRALARDRSQQHGQEHDEGDGGGDDTENGKVACRTRPAPPRAVAERERCLRPNPLVELPPPPRPLEAAPPAPAARSGPSLHVAHGDPQQAVRLAAAEQFLDTVAEELPPAARIDAAPAHPARLPPATAALERPWRSLRGPKTDPRPGPDAQWPGRLTCPASARRAASAPRARPTPRRRPPAPPRSTTGRPAPAAARRPRPARPARAHP